MKGRAAKVLIEERKALLSGSFSLRWWWYWSMGLKFTCLGAQHCGARSPGQICVNRWICYVNPFVNVKCYNFLLAIKSFAWFLNDMWCFSHDVYCITAVKMYDFKGIIRGLCPFSVRPTNNCKLTWNAQVHVLFFPNVQRYFALVSEVIKHWQVHIFFKAMVCT